MTDRPKILDEDEPLENVLRVFERRDGSEAPAWRDSPVAFVHYAEPTWRERVADRWDAMRCWITRGRR